MYVAVYDSSERAYCIAAIRGVISNCQRETVLAGFLRTHPQARANELPAAIGVTAGQGRQNLPGSAGMDGFFYASVGKVDR